MLTSYKFMNYKNLKYEIKTSNENVIMDDWMNEIFKRGLLWKFTIFPETLKGSKTGMKNRCVNIKYKLKKESKLLNN